MSDRHEELMRVLLHDLRTPLNVVGAALDQLDVPPDDRYVELARNGTRECAFALSFVQRALDVLSADPRPEAIDATTLQSALASVVAGSPAESWPLSVDDDLALRGTLARWEIALGALRMLARKESVSVRGASKAAVDIARETPWSVGSSADDAAFASLRPGYAGWVLDEMRDRGFISVKPEPDPTCLRLIGLE